MNYWLDIMDYYLRNRQCIVLCLDQYIDKDLEFDDVIFKYKAA